VRTLNIGGSTTTMLSLIVGVSLAIVPPASPTSVFPAKAGTQKASRTFNRTVTCWDRADQGAPSDGQGGLGPRLRGECEV